MQTVLALRMQGLGTWLKYRQKAIRRLQWLVVGFYSFLIIVPAVEPLPGQAAHIWSNLTLFAQFIFWGIWWPFVLLSMILVGRSWCGIFCPEGTLSEIVSHRGLGLHVPKWLTWRGWPFVAFIGTTIYGQMISVYQYPKAVLVILGGSTLAAMAIGLLYGRDKRVWCRYLCPVNGVFALLAKLAPVHFRVDHEQWNTYRKNQDAPLAAFNCAPLVPVRTMQGGAQCHMCGRCSGFRGAISLAPRPFAEEVITADPEKIDIFETLLILFGLMGVAIGAFHWSASPWFVSLKQLLADYLADTPWFTPLTGSAPWWLLTNYPDQNDVLTWLDGIVMLIYILGTSLVIGGTTALGTILAVRSIGPWSWRRFHQLVQAFIPLAGGGVFLGLSALTVTLLHTDGFDIPGVGILRGLCLTGAALWSLRLAWRMTETWGDIRQRIAAEVIFVAALAPAITGWALLFWIW